jgi:hypothetical protein
LLFFSSDTGATPGEPFGDAAIMFTRSKALQHDVQVEFVDVDRAGNFVGHVYVAAFFFAFFMQSPLGPHSNCTHINSHIHSTVGGENLAELLVAAGLATVHPSAERYNCAARLTAAEEVWCVRLGSRCVVHLHPGVFCFRRPVRPERTCGPRTTLRWLPLLRSLPLPPLPSRFFSVLCAVWLFFFRPQTHQQKQRQQPILKVADQKERTLAYKAGIVCHIVDPLTICVQPAESAAALNAVRLARVVFFLLMVAVVFCCFFFFFFFFFLFSPDDFSPS